MPTVKNNFDEFPLKMCLTFSSILLNINVVRANLGISGSIPLVKRPMAEKEIKKTAKKKPKYSTSTTNNFLWLYHQWL